MQQLRIKVAEAWGLTSYCKTVGFIALQALNGDTAADRNTHTRACMAPQQSMCSAATSSGISRMAHSMCIAKRFRECHLACVQDTSKAVLQCKQ